MLSINKGNREAYILYAVLLVWAVALLLMPKNELSYDSYDYAAQIKFGIELFSPHHLLHNAFWWVVLLPIRHLFPSIEVLRILQLGNTLLVFACVIVLYLLLIELKKSHIEALGIVWIVGCCNCTVFFASEVEAYLLPLFFSLVGTYFFWKYLCNLWNSHALISAFFLALACLFHQLHFWWWLAIGLSVLGRKQYRKFLVILLFMALIVPTMYAVVWLTSQSQEFEIHSFIGFVFHDFFHGHTHSPLDWKVIPMFIISLIRTFIQVHPTQWLLLQNSLLYAVPAAVVLMFLLYQWKKYTPSFFIKPILSEVRILRVALILALLFHVLFALYARGNSEFMVMLPFLLALLLAMKVDFNFSLLFRVGLACMIWQSAYVLWPQYRFHIWGHQSAAEAIIREPKRTFVLNKAEAITLAFYKSGVDGPTNWIHVSRLNQNLLDSLIVCDGYIYSDVPNRSVLFDRGAIFREGEQINWKPYHLKIVNQSETLVGDWAMYRVSK